MVLYHIPLFKSWVRASVDTSYLQGQGYANESLALSQQKDLVINQFPTRECEDLSFPKKHALAEVRWDQIPRVHRALLRVSLSQIFYTTARLEVSPNLRHAEVFQTSTMVNLGIVFQEPLTRSDIKLDEKMSICSSTPEDHRAYTNSNQSSIGFDYFFFFSWGEFDSGRLPNLIEPYRSIKFDLLQFD